MTTKEAAAARVNTPQRNSYRVYHADLLAQLEGDPGKLFLLHAIAFFDWGDEPRETGDAADIDHDYWERHWHMREKARRVIQGAEPFPTWARRWKAMQELRYYHGRRKRPAWLDGSRDSFALADVRAELKPASLRSLKLKARR